MVLWENQAFVVGHPGGYDPVVHLFGERPGQYTMEGRGVKRDPLALGRLLPHMRHMAIPLVFLVVPAVALGYVAEFGISDVTWIYNAEGQFRVLARIDSLAQLSGCKVQFAMIVLPLSRESASGNISVFSVARPWESEIVSWGYPWAAVGGDFRGGCVASWEVHADATLPAHFLDVTQYVQEVADGGQDFGLLLAPSDDTGSGFDVGMRPLLLQLSQSKVHVFYRCKLRP